MRFLLFSADLPVQRLEADIEDFSRFTLPDERTAHARLVEAVPPLTPAAEAIVRALIHAYGAELLGKDGLHARLRGLMTAGAIYFGRTALLIGNDAPVPERARRLLTEFERIFERYPESGYAQARHLLSAIGLPVGHPASGKNVGGPPA
ncbi:hypothetical protein [Paraburkholderia sp. JHI869]|uniref:hypothetical protein n=1 Tax=Paraburkholderia sp. JHI869 TaxID=3112959 RepID=UPI00317F45F5